MANLSLGGAVFLVAARSCRALVAERSVGDSWTQPSALPGFTVGGLACQLGAQVPMAAGLLTAPAPDGPVVSAVEHYARASWVEADRDDAVNVAIRDGGEHRAREGAGALLAAVDEAIAALDAGLPAADLGRPVPTPAGPWALPLGDALLTRAMEIAVHSDDLAVSVGLPTPSLPAEVIDPVLCLLAFVAARRHGQATLLRALTRAERAPASISAFGPA
jgi:hypothetical protein